MSSTLDRTALVDGGPALDAAGLVHRVLQPARSGPHPTIVMLHGLGGDGSAMWLLGPALPRGWLVTSPQAPLREAGGYAWRRVPAGTWTHPASFDAAVSAVLRFADALPALYGADPDALHLMGFSQGAALAFAIAMRHPGRVRSVASVVGFVPAGADDSSVAGLAGLPVFMAVGRRDALVPAAVSGASAALLRSVGADLACREYDVGHKLGTGGMRDLRAWYERVVARQEAVRPPAPLEGD